MMTPEELATWQEAVRAWNRDHEPEELAEALRALAEEDRGRILGQIAEDLRGEVVHELRALGVLSSVCPAR